MPTDKRMVRKLPPEVTGPPTPSGDAEDGRDRSDAGTVDEGTRGLLTINPDVEILAVLRTVEEMTLSLYHMAQGVYGGLGQFRFIGADDEMIKRADKEQEHLAKAGMYLRLAHDNIAFEIGKRRGRVKEIFANEKAPAPEKVRGPSSYM